MNYQKKFDSEHFAQYLQSMVKLDDLQKMTDDLDEELRDSQFVLNDIKTMFDTLPKATNTQQNNNGLRHEDISEFLAAEVPRLLMPDMTQDKADIDLDNLIATMKRYVEELKKNITIAQPRKDNHTRKYINNIDLAPYASSLDKLSKQLERMKLNQPEITRNEELEAKLNQLCQDVNLLTQMVETKTKLSENNQSWTLVQCDDTALLYDNMISKLLSGINEVTYLLKNKN